MEHIPVSTELLARTIVFVHGTGSDSRVWKATLLLLHGRWREGTEDRCQLKTFGWSGSNSHDARLQAARDLARWLESETVDAAESVILVGHSHGGNVCYAAAFQAVTSRIAKIITLGTPFISVHKREIAKAWPTVVGSVAIWGAVLIGLAFFRSIPYLTSVDTPEWIIWTVFFFLGVIAPMYAINWWMFDSDTLLRRVLRAQDAEYVRLTHSQITIPILCFNVSLDEAGTWLYAVRWLAEIPAVTLEFFGSANREYLRLYDNVGDWLITRGPLATMLMTDHRLIHGILAGAFLPALAFSSALLVTVPSLIRAHRLGFGERGLATNLLLNIGVTSTPIFATNVSTMGVTPGRSFLRHSSFFSDEKVISIISGSGEIAFAATESVTTEQVGRINAINSGKLLGGVYFWSTLLWPLWLWLIMIH